MTVVGVVCGLGPDGFLASHRNYIDAIVRAEQLSDGYGAEEILRLFSV